MRRQADARRALRCACAGMSRSRLSRLLRRRARGASPALARRRALRLGVARRRSPSSRRCMFCIDARRDPARRSTLPALADRGVRSVHRFRQSGWFLVPLGSLLLAIALVASPSLPRMSPARARGARGAARLSVSGDRAAGPGRHHRQAADRARPAAGRRQRGSFPLQAASCWQRRICELSVRPCHRSPSRPRSRSARFGRGRGRCCGPTPS